MKRLISLLIACSLEASTCSNAAKCTDLAAASLKTKTSDIIYDADRAARLESSCEQGIMISCSLLGAALAAPEHASEKNRKKAILLLEKSCAASEGMGCLVLGSMYYAGEGVKKDLARAAEFLKVGCDSNFGAACSQLADMYDNAEGGLNDHVMAAKLFKKACDLKDSQGCAQLGNFYYEGEYYPRDFAKAAELYKIGCDADVEYACTQLGYMHEVGEGFMPDANIASVFYKKGCELDDSFGCYNQAALLYNQAELESALEFFKKACALGEEESCGLASEIETELFDQSNY